MCGVRLGDYKCIFISRLIISLVSISWCSGIFSFSPPSVPCAQCQKLTKNFVDSKRNWSFWQVYTQLAEITILAYMNEKEEGIDTWCQEHYTFYFNSLLYLETYLNILLTCLKQILSSIPPTQSPWVLPLLFDIRELISHEVRVDVCAKLSF